MANGYGARDAGFIAHECPAGNLHICAENLVVETVRADGQAAAEGELGEIVVTHLETQDFPFVRYRTGDMGVLGTQRCACGRGLPLLREVQGKANHLVVAQDGSVLPATALTYVLREMPQLVQYQVHQLALHAMQQVREALRSTRDEMQTSQEELKSTNEELQSTNEELQSTNEELTTSREEMQSMNEELQSVNNELTAKVEEMSQASDDMKNLLNSTAIATLFLDEQMRVRRFTTQTTSIFKLIPSDVGRPITDQVTTLDYSHLASDAQEVLRTLVFREVQVRGEGARWFTARCSGYSSSPVTNTTRRPKWLRSTPRRRAWSASWDRLDG